MNLRNCNKIHLVTWPWSMRCMKLYDKNYVIWCMIWIMCIPRFSNRGGLCKKLVLAPQFESTTKLKFSNDEFSPFSNSAKISFLIFRLSQFRHYIIKSNGFMQALLFLSDVVQFGCMWHCHLSKVVSCLKPSWLYRIKTLPLLSCDYAKT